MKIGKILLAALLIAGVIMAVLLLPVRQWFMHSKATCSPWAPIGPVVVVLAYILSTVLFIPGSALTIGSGTLFGLTTGFAVVFLGANSARSVLSYWREPCCEIKSRTGRRLIQNFALSIRRSASKDSKWSC